MTLQQYWGLEALKEAGIAFSKVEFLHGKGMMVYYPLGGVNPPPVVYRNPVWPRWVLEYARDNTLDDFGRCDMATFTGAMSARRAWMRECPSIDLRESNLGRDESIKYRLDKHYLIHMSGYKFAACPTGDFPWSYRLFEAVMAGCIPIVEDNDIFRGVFPHYFSLDKLRESSDYIRAMFHSDSMARENFQVLIQRCTLNGKI